MAETSDQKIRALTMFRENPSEDYRKALNLEIPTLLTSSQAKDMIFSLDALRAFEKKIGFVGSIIALKRVALTSAKNLTEALEILSPSIENPSEGYVKEIKDLKKEKLELLSSLTSSASEVHKLEVEMNDIHLSISIKSNFIKRTNSPTEFISALQWAFANPNEQYSAEIKKLFSSQIAQFLLKNPSAQNVQSYALHLHDVAEILKLKKGFLLATKSREEFKKAIQFSRATPSEAYIAQTEKMLQSLEPKMVELEFSNAEYNQLRGQLKLKAVSDSESPVGRSALKASPLILTCSELFG